MGESQITSDNDDIVQLEDVLSEIRQDAKLMARDLISGVDMTKTVSRLLMLMGLVGVLLVTIFFVVLPLARGGRCCYVITYEDLLAGIVSIALIGFSLWSWRSIRRKYLKLRTRYKRLLELEAALGK